MHRLIYVIALGGALSGCAASQQRARPVGIVEAPVNGWRDKALVPDAGKIDAMAARLAAARGRARQHGNAGSGALLAGPALDHPAPTPGPYHCRLVRIGAAAGRGGLRSFPGATCYVGGDPGNQLSFATPAGDAPSGWLYPDDVTTRYVFLGARQRKGHGDTLAYGADATRNLAGVVERIGTFRWRLVIATAAPDSLDVYDLTPITGAPGK